MGEYSAPSWSAPISWTDLAVLYIESDNLPVIPRIRSVCRTGDVVLAIGNPYNVGQTITQGIISATGRIGLSSIRAGQQRPAGSAADRRRHQRGQLGRGSGQCPRRPGGHQHRRLPPHGQPGELRHQLRHSHKLAKRIMDELIANGRVIRGYLGISSVEINPIVGAC